MALKIYISSTYEPWPPGLMDSTTGENAQGAKIQALRKSLRETHMASMFESADELAAKVVAALYQWQTESSAVEAATAAGGERKSEYRDAGQPASQRKDQPLLWMPGSRLRVRFLSGDETLRARVIRLAQIWSAYANLSFTESVDEDAEIRIAFKPGAGSWSYEGTNCLKIRRTEPTINFGWLRVDSSIEEFESVVLHEFGHVLGLGHEHQNPTGAVPWSREKVYKTMSGPPTYWSKAMVDENVFRTWSTDRFPLQKPFDPLSIMVNSFPAELTGGKQLFSRNVAISPGDKEFVSRLYPYPTAAPARRPKAPTKKRSSRSSSSA